MKLELRHLEPFLRYGLEIGTPHGNQTMTGLTSSGVKYSGIATASFQDIVPIVRPLSDLNKEYKKGVRYIDAISVGMWKDLEATIEWINGDCSFGITIMEVNQLREGLLSHYFDLDGLIDKGLAIDINTIRPMKEQEECPKCGEEKEINGD